MDTKSKFANVRMGARVRVNYGAGCGEAYGKVYGRTKTRWGEELRIKLDDYTFIWIHGFVTVGIGAYLLD